MNIALFFICSIWTTVKSHHQKEREELIITASMQNIERVKVKVNISQTRYCLKSLHI